MQQYSPYSCSPPAALTTNGCHPQPCPHFPRPPAHAPQSSRIQLPCPGFLHAHVSEHGHTLTWKHGFSLPHALSTSNCPIHHQVDHPPSPCRNVITPVKAHRHHIPTLESTKSFDINAMERVRRLACDGRAAVDPPLLTGAGCLNSPFPCTVHFILLNQRTCIHVYIQIMLHSCALILPLCTQMVHLRHGHRSSAPSSHSSLLLPVPTCHL